jgi:hypothetical protein
MMRRGLRNPLRKLSTVPVIDIASLVSLQSDPARKRHTAQELKEACMHVWMNMCAYVYVCINYNVFLHVCARFAVISQAHRRKGRVLLRCESRSGPVFDYRSAHAPAIIYGAAH